MVKSLLSIEDLSLDEQTAVTQLKQRMIGCIDQEMFEDLSMFVRFLRARDLNINAAEAMLKNHIEWRKKIQLDTILTDYTIKEVLKKYVVFDTMGIDKEGSPILYFNVGGLDSRGLLKSARKIDIIKTIVHKLENNLKLMKKESYKRGKHIDKWTMILNFENLSFGVATHKETLEVIGQLITMYEANYPERLKVAYLVNASIYFAIAFEVVKRLISAPTYRKIHIFGKDGWLDEVLKMVDPEVLPGFLGGKRTDPDGNPMCHTYITHGGPVPQSYYTNKKESTLANVPGVETLTVTRMSKNHIKLDVTESGSHIEWEFETKSRDIGFALLYKRDKYDNKTEELIPKTRIDTNVCSETGIFKCTKLGVYIIEFDNTYSWIYQKQIYYKISVVTAKLIK